MKDTKGITLIALVVTIIVLLILASVAIGQLRPDNGILSKSKQARNETENAQESEQVRLAIMDAIARGANNDSEAIVKDDLKAALETYFSDVTLTDVTGGGWTFVATNNTYTISATGEITAITPNE